MTVNIIRLVYSMQRFKIRKLGWGKMYTYKTKGTCAREIKIRLNGNYIDSVEFIGGCNGNLKAIASVVKGMDIERVRDLFEGNTCNSRTTSCVDQLAKGLYAAKDNL